MQNETEKLLLEYIKKSPKLIKELVASDVWTDYSDRVSTQFSLGENKKNILKNEILFVLIGLEPRTDFKENIEKELELDLNAAERIAEEVNKNIFSKVVNEIDSMWQETENTPERPKSTGAEPATQGGKGVGNSFEQIILNQAKAMQPARGSSQTPNNLPTESKPQYKVPDYRGGSDPYRESLG